MHGPYARLDEELVEFSPAFVVTVQKKLQYGEGQR